jgi:hypothetical protein
MTGYMHMDFSALENKIDNLNDKIANLNEKVNNVIDDMKSMHEENGKDLYEYTYEIRLLITHIANVQSNIPAASLRGGKGKCRKCNSEEMLTPRGYCLFCTERDF